MVWQLVGVAVPPAIMWRFARRWDSWSPRLRRVLFMVGAAGLLAVQLGGGLAVTESVLLARGELVYASIGDRYSTGKTRVWSYDLNSVGTEPDVHGELYSRREFEDGEVVLVRADPAEMVRPSLLGEGQSVTGAIVLALAGVLTLGVVTLGFGYPLHRTMGRTEDQRSRRRL